MRRRELMLLLGGAMTAGRALRAQRATPVIGFLGVNSPGAMASYVAAFHRGLSETGYIEGQNVTVEYRWAEGRYDRLPALAADLVGRKVDVIATSGAGARAAKDATSTISIVSLVGDPIATGLYASLARPGGNLTGVSPLTSELTPKRLELLSELVPQAGLTRLFAGQIGFQRHPFDKSDQGATGTDDISQKIAVIALSNHKRTASSSTRLPICGFSASRVTRSTRRSTNTDSASSSARNSERPRGRSNSTSTSRSLLALALPRATEPNIARDPIGQRCLRPGRAARSAARISSFSIILQPNTAQGGPLRPPRLVLMGANAGWPVPPSILARADEVIE
jgi:hypothetical protein